MIIEAPHGVIGLWDSGSFSPPLVSEDRSFLTALRGAAQRRDVFFIDAEDAVTYNVEMVIDQDLPPHVAESCEVRTGSFGLHVPTGRLRLDSVPPSSVSDEVAVPPGDYLVTPMARRHFDVQWHNQVMRHALGDRDWRYHNAVIKLGGFGCIAWVLFVVLMLIPATRWLWPFTGPLLVLPWFLYFLLSKMPRFKGIELRQRLREAEIPHFAIVLRRSVTAAELPGGWTSGI